MGIREEYVGLVLGDRGRANILIIAYLFMKYDNFQNDRHNLFSRLKKITNIWGFFLGGGSIFHSSKRTETFSMFNGDK